MTTLFTSCCFSGEGIRVFAGGTRHFGAARPIRDLNSFAGGEIARVTGGRWSAAPMPGL